MKSVPLVVPRFKPRRFQRRPSEAARWNDSAHVVLVQSITAERSGSSNTRAEMSTNVNQKRPGLTFMRKRPIGDLYTCTAFGRTTVHHRSGVRTGGADG